MRRSRTARSFGDSAAAWASNEELFADTDEDLVRTALESDDPLLEGVTWEHLLEHGYAKAAVGDDWRPYADGGFGTPSGKAELYSAALEEQGHDPLPAHVAAAESPSRRPEARRAVSAPARDGEVVAALPQLAVREHAAAPRCGGRDAGGARR